MPENTFVMIGITAKNTSDEKTRAYRRTILHYVDEKDQKHKAFFGEFSSKDLVFSMDLEPNKPIEITTQFDIPFDEDETIQNNYSSTKGSINYRYSCQFV